MSSDYTPDAIAWDIETAPMPLSVLTQRQRRRLQKEYDEQVRRNPEAGVTEHVRQAMCFHSFLCWICCASMAWRGPNGEIQQASKTASKPVEERPILQWLWRTVSRSVPGRASMTWVTYNGKNFDARVVRTRSLRNEVPITNEDLIDEYPYSYSPHCDIACLWRDEWNGLADVADLFGIVYDSQIMGEDVPWAVSEGRTDLVQEHCEADVEATLKVYEHVDQFNPEIR